MDRKEILKASEECVCKDRQDAYGKPENNFAAICNLWNQYLLNKYGFDSLNPTDIGVLMALMKIGRITSGKHNIDNYIDAIGYLACAGEIAEKFDYQDMSKKLEDAMLESITLKSEDFE